MNTKEIMPPEKGVATKNIFKTENSTAMVIQILKGEKLKEHTTPKPALLVCISGEALFENEKKYSRTLKNGDFVQIEVDVIHSVKGIQDSHLILFK